jgi:spermidine/putrescine transport system permease protein
MRQSRFPLYTLAGVIVFFYLPIVVLVINSFNSARFGGRWRGFSFKWYIELFKQEEIWRALQNTLVIAVGATLLSILIGTLAAFALHRFSNRLQRVHYTLIYSPLVFPDILMGMSLLLFFIAVGMKLGLFTIFIAHVTFCISYVAMVVLSRLQDFDYAVIEAAQDLGANWWTTLWRIILPILAPGIAAGGLLAFTLSIDDFVISFFVAGPGATTLPIRIYSMIKHGSPSIINALSTILLFLTFILIYVSQRLLEERTK